LLLEWEDLEHEEAVDALPPAIRDRVRGNVSALDDARRRFAAEHGGIPATPADPPPPDAPPEARLAWVMGGG
jgi:hypothetical protein